MAAVDAQLAVERDTVGAHDACVKAACDAARELESAQRPPNETLQRQLDAVNAALASRGDMDRLKCAVSMLGQNEILAPPALQEPDNPLTEVFLQVNGDGEVVRRTLFDQLSAPVRALFEMFIKNLH